MSESPGCLKRIAWGIAGILAAVVVLSMPFVITGRAMGRVLFSPIAVTGILRRQVLDSGMFNTLITDQVLSGDFLKGFGGEESEIGQALQYLSPAERQDLLAAVIPEGWVERQFSNLLHAAYSWIDNDKALPDLAIDLKPIKAGMLSGGLSSFVDVVVDSWPACSTEQIEAMREGLFTSGEVPLILCEPSEPLRSVVVQYAEGFVASSMREMPNELRLLDGAAPRGQDVSAMKANLRLLRVLLRWSWFLPVSLLGVIMALAIRSWRSLGRWWGIPLFLGGGLTLFFLVILSSAREALLAGVLGDLGAAGEIVMALAEAAMIGVLAAVTRVAAVQGAIVAATGLLLWVLTAWISAARARRAGVVEAPAPPASEPKPVPPGQQPPPLPPLEQDNQDSGEPPTGIFG